MSGIIGLANNESGLIGPSAGTVLQTQRYTSSDQTYITSDAFSTGKTVGNFAFTPKLATSNILLMVSVTSYASSAAGYIFMDLYKNASDFSETANLSGYTQGLCISHYGSVWQTTHFHWLDECSENSTSTKTYKVSARINDGAGNGYIGWGSNNLDVVVIQEIAT